MRDSKLILKKVVESRADTLGLLQKAGDAVLIERDKPRWLIMICPCGCGEEIPVNLDSRAGPAWRVYRNQRTGISLFPSVWRDTGCRSHFIVWRDEILLLGHRFGESRAYGKDEDLVKLGKILQEKWPTTGFVPFVDVADLLGEVPWDVLDACRHLVKRGMLKEGSGPQRSMFCRTTDSK
jgi:hypothetical protein